VIEVDGDDRTITVRGNRVIKVDYGR